MVWLHWTTEQIMERKGHARVKFVCFPNFILLLLFPFLLFVFTLLGDLFFLFYCYVQSLTPSPLISNFFSRFFSFCCLISCFILLNGIFFCTRLLFFFLFSFPLLKLLFVCPTYVFFFTLVDCEEQMRQFIFYLPYFSSITFLSLK
ncbi:T. brucei spp.-specific protein [Trypanosoma brucei gambiense DAL972]|uniref:T. brucei spp.-specific protein n=1 Tax=Trypanosoma brucei gambiense (strain MHOM/CI/86/DAL972) TaxID=679716 RepID=C9ZIB7_TRYB9|nr:T. brucei spp.-specific protein [Trypanosoma brucei gambiense DAL972]CBH08909.1 T. brucei spp.-specific protein [Trypanosoma brucei gambiense DAL972]|eukprot:XP_011771350.1 T. brucei spp.-specific protein [Trypanosoma brucei gambiense DAL972]